MAKMSTSDVQALVNSARTDSLAAMSAMELSEARAQAVEYYLGVMQRDMPAEPGRSRAVSTDVSDTIEGSEAARQAEADESEDRFNEALKGLAQAPRPSKDERAKPDE